MTQRNGPSKATAIRLLQFLSDDGNSLPQPDNTHVKIVSPPERLACLRNQACDEVHSLGTHLSASLR